MALHAALLLAFAGLAVAVGQSRAPHDALVMVQVHVEPDDSPGFVELERVDDAEPQIDDRGRSKSSTSRLNTELPDMSRRLSGEMEQIMQNARLREKAIHQREQVLHDFRKVSEHSHLDARGSHLASPSMFRKETTIVKKPKMPFRMPLFPFAVPFPWVMRGRANMRNRFMKRAAHMKPGNSMQMAMRSLPSKSAEPSTTPTPKVERIQPATVGLVMQLNPGNLSLLREACEVLAKQVPYFGGSSLTSIRNRSHSTEDNETESDEMELASEVGAITSELKAQQVKIWNSKAPALALNSMKNNPDDHKLQASCIKLISAVTAWNRDTEEAAAKAGALELIFTAMSKFSGKKEVVSQMLPMTHLNDLSFTNRDKMQALGAVKLIAELSKTAKNAEFQLGAHRLASTLCMHPQGYQEMLAIGYPKAAIQTMSEYPNAPGVRGEVLQALNNCFMGTAENRAMMLDAGLIPELIKVLKDAPKQPDLDLLGSVRVQYNAMDMMSKLVENDNKVRDAFLQSGAVLMIRDTLMKDEPEESFLKHDRMRTACKLLHNLLGELDEQGHQMVEKTEVMDVVIPRISERIKDKALQATCRPLLSTWY